MSVFGGILLFVSGVAVGSVAVVYNHHSIRRATIGLRKENDHLKTSAWEDKMEVMCKKAYDEGYMKGRRSPLNDVERLAETIENRNIDFRTFKEGAPNGQETNRKRAY